MMGSVGAKVSWGQKGLCLMKVGQCSVDDGSSEVYFVDVKCHLGSEGQIFTIYHTTYWGIGTQR